MFISFKPFALLVGALLTLTCSAAMADPISLIAFAAGQAFPTYAFAIYAAGPVVGAPQFRRHPRRGGQ